MKYSEFGTNPYINTNIVGSKTTFSLRRDKSRKQGDLAK